MQIINRFISPSTELLTIKCKDCGNTFLFIVPGNKYSLIRCRGCSNKVAVKDLEDVVEIEQKKLMQNVNIESAESAGTDTGSRG